MKIVSIIGARPQFIKSAPLSRQIRKKHEEILVHTGQHYDPCLSEIFFRELDIPEPEINLGIGSGSQGEQTGRMIIAVESALQKISPDLVIVYGDTNSTLAGAIAASKLPIPIAHVEAGLRSFDQRMPEEINRIVTDRVSTLLFCPTRTSTENLAREGIRDGVHLVGDVMADALKYNAALAEKNSGILETLGISPHEYLVATIHRQSNTDIRENLVKILEAFGRLGETLIFPAHPRTVKYLKLYGLDRHLPENIRLIPPVGYLDMIKLMAHARKILTDSGGIQKEAYLLKVPCITLRENTEWVETVEDGWNVLAGTDVDRIVGMVKTFTPVHPQRELFGGGNASSKISEILDRMN
jgi:UDP-N-acetylglucosamine 2-epimerase (non-hydrolysing)